MKTVIIYRSKNGYTRQYAQWLAEALQCDILENEKLALERLLAYDIILYGGGIYAGRINGVNLITQNWDALREKRLIVWATGANPGRPEEMQAMWAKIFTQEQFQMIRTYYLRGGFDYRKLNLADKALMGMLKCVLKRKKDLTEDDKGMLQMYETPVDFSDRENIGPLVEYVRELQSQG